MTLGSYVASVSESGRERVAITKWMFASPAFLLSVILILEDRSLPTRKVWALCASYGNMNSRGSALCKEQGQGQGQGQDFVPLYHLTDYCCLGIRPGIVSLFVDSNAVHQ